MKWIQSCAAIAMGITLAACGGNDSDDSPTPKDNTAIRVSHLAPDAPKVNVLVDDSPFLTAVDYAQSSGLRSVPAGSYKVAVDGILPTGTATVIGPVELDLAADTQYDVLALGKLTGEGDTAFGPLVIERPNLLPAAGEIRLQVLHAAPSAPPVDVYVTAPDGALDSPAISNISFKDYSDPLSVPAGSYRVRLTLPASTDVVYDSGELPLAAGTDLLVAAVDNLGPGPSPVKLLAIGADGASPILSTNEQAQLRAIHAVADAPPVDISVNGVAPTATPLQGLAFKQDTSYLNLDAGNYDLVVTPSGVTTPELISTSDTVLKPGDRYSLFAVGQLLAGSDETIDPLLLMDTGRVVATEAQLRVLHAAPTAPEVDVYLTETADISTATPVLSKVPFLANSGYLSVGVGDYYVTVTAAGDKTAVIGPQAISLVVGQVITATALSDSSGGVDPQLLVLDDTTTQK